MSDNLIEDKQKIDILIKTAQRIDFWINSTNTKAAFIVALNAICLTGFVAKWDDIIKLFEGYDGAKVLVAILLSLAAICSLASLILVFYVTAPFLKSITGPKSDENSEYKSDFYFGDIATHGSPNAYHQRIIGWHEDSVVRDLAFQIHTLSKAATSKFNNISRSIKCIIYGVLGPICLIALTKVIVALFLAKRGDTLQ